MACRLLPVRLACWAAAAARDAVSGAAGIPSVNKTIAGVEPKRCPPPALADENCATAALMAFVILQPPKGVKQ